MEEEHTTDETMAHVFGETPGAQLSQTSWSDTESDSDIEEPMMDESVNSQLSDKTPSDWYFIVIMYYSTESCETILSDRPLIILSLN